MKSMLLSPDLEQQFLLRHYAQDKTLAILRAQIRRLYELHGQPYIYVAESTGILEVISILPPKVQIQADALQQIMDTHTAKYYPNLL